LARREERAYRTAISSSEIEGDGDQAIEPRHDVPQDEVFHNQNVSFEEALVAGEIAGVPGIDRWPVNPHQTYPLLTHIVRRGRV
jgi:hypothetical protein